MEKRTKKERDQQQDLRQEENLTLEEKINSALLYTPEIITWMDYTQSKE
ncbi:hypothetical protein OEV82_03010 [Caldibacillus thermolactis]|uniref:Uncharacterized protein n=1 Tax=Pallidibacillus thermolactis TaxID=251051 RepID=A0ABT2WCM1_9BACI|nr:hypothetical protein [Pallidibacillus thermolactis]MCU9593425.1 hypothetical protein [Pallidibacillus thermolactis]MCU9601451.1 hypothetical protein [Pallidibacillus thermolactis subsp. kokeshiiformis]MED1673791.1 hypothetical protein [Pallidibacillus thermolactis subsp. kokeshiiformis]